MGLSVNNPSAIPASSIRTGAMPPWGFLGLSKRSMEVEKIGESSCYSKIVAKYPGMDSASQLIVKILCENEQNTLDAGTVALSNQGIHGIRDALQQNTNLQSFSIDLGCLDSNEDCLTTFALDTTSALKVNHGLKTLNLNMMLPEHSMLAIQELTRNLPCFNLASFKVKGKITPAVAQDVFPKIFSQKFPLANFTWASFLTGYDPLGSIISPLSNGIGDNTCLKTLGLAQNAWNATTITSIFEGIGTSRIQRFELPDFVDENGRFAPYAFSENQTAAILESVQSNPCFLECVPVNNPLPSDLAAAIYNITKTRTPCQPDPACNVSVACSSPTPSPTPDSHAFWEGVANGAVGGAILTALAALGIYAARTCAKSGETQPLLPTQNIQQV